MTVKEYNAELGTVPIFKGYVKGLTVSTGF